MHTSLIDRPQPQGPAPKPLTEGKQSIGVLIALWAFVTIPFLALIMAGPVAGGGWWSWPDAGWATAAGHG